MRLNGHNFPAQGAAESWANTGDGFHVLSLVDRFVFWCQTGGLTFFKSHATRLIGHNFAAKGTPAILAITDDGFA